MDKSTKGATPKYEDYVPLVSIVTPAYNSAAYILETIQSVKQQTLTSWEQIIVDDCSTDQTVDIVRETAKDDTRIKLVELAENSGAAVARNEAIKIARGRYIAFLDSDDLWLPEKLEKQIRFMEARNIALSYSSYGIIDENGMEIGKYSAEETLTYSDLLKKNRIGCLTAIYDTCACGKVEMPLIRKRQDLGLWLKILRKVPRAYGIEDKLANYRKRPDSISANKFSAARYTWSLYRDVEKLNILSAMYFFGHYAFNGLCASSSYALPKKN